MPGTAKQLAQQIVAWRPHLVWCHHGRAASNGEFLATLRRSGIRTAVYLPDEPYECGESAKFTPSFDYVFTMDPCTVELHRKSRRSRSGVFYLPPGVDTDRFKRKPYFRAKHLVRETPAFFLGNADLIPRRKWLEPIDRVIDGADIRFFPHRQKQGRPVAKGHPKWVDLSDHASLYSSCIVGLNVHRSPAITRQCFKMRVLGRGAHDKIPAGLTLCAQMPKEEGTGFWNDGNLPAAHVNPRFFEMAACGTLVVSDDHRSELERMFPMAPRASSPEHFYELVSYFIGHPEQAEAIGAACSYLISKRHTYQHRAAEVLIRAGFKGLLPESQLSCLGEPEDWLSPQDCGPLGVESFLARTGRSERWSPQLGMSLTEQSGRASEATSLDVPTPWL